MTKEQLHKDVESRGLVVEAGDDPGNDGDPIFWIEEPESSQKISPAFFSLPELTGWWLRNRGGMSSL